MKVLIHYIDVSNFKEFKCWGKKLLLMFIFTNLSRIENKKILFSRLNSFCFRSKIRKMAVEGNIEELTRSVNNIVRRCKTEEFGVFRNQLLYLASILFYV